MLQGYTTITYGHLDTALYVCHEPVYHEPFLFLRLQTHKTLSVSFMYLMAFGVEKLVDWGVGQLALYSRPDLETWLLSR